MRYFTLAFLYSSFALASSPMDSYRWYLEPAGQEVLISIDDLHDETLLASPKLDWGRKLVPSLKLKKEVTIAIIDGGFDIEHPELKDHVLLNPTECYEGKTIPPKNGDDNDKNGLKGDCAGWDFVENANRPEDKDGHGTHVTGIINSVMEDVQGSYKFLSLKVFAPNEGKEAIKDLQPLSFRLIAAFNYALARKVDIIHLSVGWPKAYMTVELEAAIRKTIDSGILVIAASGNSSQRATIYPCQLEGVICVGALRPNGDVARFSNWGSQVDIYAPGEKILSTIPLVLDPKQINRKGYDYKNGTSQAAPFISGAAGILRGLYPTATSSEIYSKLLLAADKMINGKGLKGQFHLDKSVALRAREFVYPVMKGINDVTLDSHLSARIEIPVKNFGALKSKATSGTLTCPDFSRPVSTVSIKSLNPLEKMTVSFSGVLTSMKPDFSCKLQIADQSVEFKLKVLRNFENLQDSKIVSQTDPLVINTRTGGKSRFLTMNATRDTTPGPLYFVSGAKVPTVYHEDRLLGTIPLRKDCKFLRFWQMDFDKNGQNEIMEETLCEEKYLRYEFYDLNLKEVYPSVSYKPTLTIVNYEDFTLIPQKSGPPIFRFMNMGFSIPSTDPWADQGSSKGVHFWELFPIKDGESFKFDVRILENPTKWAKDLDLRFLPSFQILQHIGDRLLINMNRKTAWVDLKTQTATWAKMDDILIEGSTHQRVLGSKQDILQNFLTPYEYRGFIVDGVNLAFSQSNLFDPLISVMNTTKNDLGYLSVLQSFQSLIYVQFDAAGNQISQRSQTVDRFDFLSGQDLLSTIVNLEIDGEAIQVVDGTKINTQYIDVIKNGKVVSYEVPFACVTQQPILMDGRATLPLFCSKSKDEFEMRFYNLK
jgi:Subtilase family